MNFKLGELFCGPGGMALGAKLAENQVSSEGQTFYLSHVWGVDRDSNAINTYNANLLGEGVKCDARDFAQNLSGCEHKVISNFERINALAFGFPCNDFSNVGERKGLNGNFGQLYRAGLSAIKHSNPKWFIAENVSGIHSANAGHAFRKILQDLQSSGNKKYGGYNLTVHLYKFEEYGVPQSRHRYIIVGIRRDQNITFRVPAPTHQDNYVTASQALNKSYEVSNPPNNEKTKQDPRIVERLLFTPPWKNAWYLEKILDMTASQRQKALQSSLKYNSDIKHLSDEEIVRRIEACRLHCTRAKMSHIYKRLHPDKPSYTVTGSGGGGTHVYHWEECRALTNRERARLQSFPDTFIFEGGKDQVRKQIGMAVPPEGAKVIFEAILKSFAKIEYESIAASYTFLE